MDHSEIAYFQALQAEGVHFAYDMQRFSPEALAVLHNSNLAFDAQPILATTPDSGIPSYLSNYFDPKQIDIIFAPMKAAIIVGESQRGDWLTQTAAFPLVESTGETSSYGDHANGGMSSANAEFPYRESYHYQTITQWGEKELARMALAKIDWASRLNTASILILNKFQNLTYFFGVSGLQNYGLLNDPLLNAPITPAVKALGGVSWAVATASEVYQDVLNMFSQLQLQTDGNVTMEDKMVLALSPTAAVNLNKVSALVLVKSAMDAIKTNFPNLRIETAPEYATTAGQLVQLIVEEFEGQMTATAAFTEKLRAHRIVMEMSAFKQKKSQGTWGTIIFRPAMISQMLGA